MAHRLLHRSAMSRVLSAAVVFGWAFVGAGAAVAQTNGTASVTAVDLPSSQQFVLTSTQAERQGLAERTFLLSWQVSNGSGLRYRLSFEDQDIRTTPRALVPVTNSTGPGSSNDGSVPGAGTYTIQVRESDLLEYVRTSTAIVIPEDGQTGTLALYILVFTIDDTPDETSNLSRDQWSFEFDFRGPPGPELDALQPGERTLEVGFTPPTVGDLQFLEIRYCAGLSDMDIRTFERTPVDDGKVDITGTSTTVWRLPEGLPCSGGNVFVEGSIRETETRFAMSEGIEAGTWTAFSLLSQDQSPFLNRTPDEDRVTYAVRAEAIDDFFELQNTGEDGGFCFVATAAHGSYAHPVVVGLRWFRDQILARVPGGAWLIRTYYALSPPLARAVAQRPELAAGVRVGLVVFGVSVVAALGFFGWGMLSLVRRTVRTAWVGLGLVALLGGSAEAQVRAEAEGAVGLGFEFKVGPYRPVMGDGVDDGGLEAWDLVYGAGNANPAFNIGGELQFYRGPIGTVSVGGTAGLAIWEGRGRLRLEPDGNEQTPDSLPGPKGTSTFNLIPLTLTLGYRLDYLQDYTPIPLAPYIRGGLAYTVWWNTRDDGALSRVGPEGDRSEALGGKPGLTGTVGVALSLNALDPRAAAKFRGSSGVRSSYLFFEGQLAWIDGFGGDGFDLSTTTWYGGLMLEL